MFVCVCVCVCVCLCVCMCVCVTIHAQITQNSKFAIFLKNLKKEVEWSCFLHAYKHESFLPIDAMIFDGDGQAFYIQYHFIISISIYLQHLDHQVFLNDDTIIIERHDQALSNYTK